MIDAIPNERKFDFWFDFHEFLLSEILSKSSCSLPGLFFQTWWMISICKHNFYTGIVSIRKFVRCKFLFAARKFCKIGSAVRFSNSKTGWNQTITIPLWRKRKNGTGSAVSKLHFEINTAKNYTIGKNCVVGAIWRHNKKLLGIITIKC